MERPESPPGVVEDTVKDDAHPSRVTGVEELTEGGRPTEERVDCQVVVGVVPVVRGRLEDWREVEGGDPKILQVVEMLGDPEQVAALEAVGGGQRQPGLDRPGLHHTVA